MAECGLADIFSIPRSSQPGQHLIVIHGMVIVDLSQLEPCCAWEIQMARGARSRLIAEMENWWKLVG